MELLLYFGLVGSIISLFAQSYQLLKNAYPNTNKKNIIIYLFAIVVSIFLWFYSLSIIKNQFLLTVIGFIFFESVALIMILAKIHKKIIN